MSLKAFMIPQTVPKSPTNGAAEAVVDGFAEAVIGDRCDGDGFSAGAVGGAQMREEVRGRLGQVAGRAEVQGLREAGAKTQPDLTVTRLGGVEAQRPDFA